MAMDCKMSENLAFLVLLFHYISMINCWQPQQHRLMEYIHVNYLFPLHCYESQNIPIVSSLITIDIEEDVEYIIEIDFNDPNLNSFSVSKVIHFIVLL
jgi:hypothetical protein